MSSKCVDFMMQFQKKSLGGGGFVETPDILTGRLHPIATNQRFTPAKGRGIELRKPHNFIGKAPVPKWLGTASMIAAPLDFLGGLAQMINEEKDLKKAPFPEVQREINYLENLNNANQLNGKQQFKLQALKNSIL